MSPRTLVASLLLALNCSLCLQFDLRLLAVVEHGSDDEANHDDEEHTAERDAYHGEIYLSLRRLVTRIFQRHMSSKYWLVVGLREWRIAILHADGCIRAFFATIRIFSAGSFIIGSRAIGAFNYEAALALFVQLGILLLNLVLGPPLLESEYSVHTTESC